MSKFLKQKYVILCILLLTITVPLTSCKNNNTYSKAKNKTVVSENITKTDIANSQKKWGDGIVKIGKTFEEKGDYKKEASNMIKDLYNYNSGDVIFKPTKAYKERFRPTEKGAISYFVGGIYDEDKGFAIQPWSKVRFDNKQTIIDNNTAIASGIYYFKDVKTGDELEVDYTFGYIKDKNNKIKIQLHHSSLPYK